MYIYKMHVSKASFTLTQLSIQHLFLENSSKAVNSPIVLLLLWITTRQLSWKKKFNKFQIGEIPRLSMIKFKVNLPGIHNLTLWRICCIHIYTSKYLFCFESLVQEVIWVHENFLTSSLTQFDYIPQILTLLQNKCFKGSGPLVAHSKSHKVFPIKKMLITWYILHVVCLCITIWFISKKVP